MIVLTPFSSTVTKKVKQESWEKIQKQLNGVGANIDSAKHFEMFYGSIFARLLSQKLANLRRLVQGEVESSPS